MGFVYLTAHHYINSDILDIKLNNSSIGGGTVGLFVEYAVIALSISVPYTTLIRK